MTEVEKGIKKMILPSIFSMGNVDLIFQLDLSEKDLQKSLSVSKSVSSINSQNFDLDNINSIKDLYFLNTKRKTLCNKIKLKGANPTLNQLLTGNEKADEKCIIDYIGFGPIKFKKEEEFFTEIFNFVTLKHFLIINESPLDKKAKSSLTIELKYKNETKIINYEPNFDENEEKENEEKENEEKENEEKENEEELVDENKPKFRRPETIFNNIKLSLKKYDLVYLNYDNIKKIPGDFKIDDLFDLLDFFKKKGTPIFLNFFNPLYEIENNDYEENENGDLNKNDINTKLYNLCQIYFFDTEQAKKYLQIEDDDSLVNYSENKEINIHKKIFYSFIKKFPNISADEIKTGLFLNNLEKFLVISLINNKPYRKNYLCDLYPKVNQDNDNINDGNINNFNIYESNNIYELKGSYNEFNNNENNDEINQEIIEEYKNIIEEYKVEYYSMFISLFVNNFAYNCKNFHLFKIINKIFAEAIKLIKEEIELIKLKNQYQYNEFKYNEYNNDYNKNDFGNDNYDKNILYLIDTTYSMSKYKNLIYSIEELNQQLINIYDNINIGYVLYKDFISENINILKTGQTHIKIIPPSSEQINIQDNENFNFEGGNDYAEDWANPLNEISQMKLGDKNIVVHICDSGAHGNRFSNYCKKNEQEDFLVNALNNCSKKDIKIIGIMLNEYAEQSFLECQKIYKENDGYYDIVDLSKNNCNEQSFINIIKESIKNALKNTETYIKNKKKEGDISGEILDENDFKFHGYNVKMRNLSQIGKYKGKKFNFLPKIEKNEEIESIQGIEQGAIGDCYLISSILSMVSKFPLIFNYIFPRLDYDENSDIIKMYVYKNGIRKLISFKNTYATKDEQNLLFAKPYNNELYGICLEKGYAISKIDETIQSGYENIVGGSGYQVFESILGTSSEKYKSNHEYFQKRQTSYKLIEKDKLREKIKKYIDYGGIITFGVFYNENSAHEYSLQGYKIDKKKEMFLDIINPHRSGQYTLENIFVEEDYNNLSQEDKDEYDSRKTPKISENDFKTRESKQSLNSYYKTGFLHISLDAFFNWFGTIDICDPMFGSYDNTIVFFPDGNNLYSIDFEIKQKTKFKVNLVDEYSKISQYKMELIKDNQQNIISEENCDLIYEILKKGSYQLKISKNSEINNKIYVKIQCYDKLKINVNQKNNNVLIADNNAIFSDVYNQMNNMKNIFKKLQICSHNKKINIFSKPDSSNIYYSKIEYTNVEGILNFPNFYFDYQNTESGFCLNILNKWGFEKENNFVIKQNGENILCSNRHGNFVLTKDLIMTGFDDKFKNYLRSQGFEGDQIDLKEMDEIVEINEEVKKEEEGTGANEQKTDAQKSGCCVIV